MPKELISKTRIAEVRDGKLYNRETGEEIALKTTYTPAPEAKVRSGSNIPQHPLITFHQWNRLQKGEIKQLTYRVTKGSHKKEILFSRVRITAEDLK